MRPVHSDCNSARRRRSVRAKVAVAATTAAASCMASYGARADSYSTSSSTITLIEPGGTFSGATRATAEGDVAGSFAAYSVFDFKTSGITPPQGQIFTLNSDILTITLQDRAPLDNFAVSGPVDFFFATNVGSVAAARFQGVANNSGVGTALGNLTPITTFNYVAGTSTSAGRVDTISFNFGTSLANFVQNQVQSGGLIRIIAAPHTTSVEANWEGSAGLPTGVPPLSPPKLTLDLTPTSIPATDAVFTVTNSDPASASKSITTTINRLYTGGIANTTVSVLNSGTGSGYLTLPGSAGVSGSFGTNSSNLAGGSLTPITVSIAGSSFTAGVPTTAAPGTGTLSLHNLSNASDTPDAVVNIKVNSAVTARFVDNVGGNAGVNYGRLLVGATAAANVTLDTENTGSSGSNTLTIVKLLGSTSISGTNANFTSGTNNKGSITIAADPSGTDTTFTNGLDSTNRDTVFTALKPGAYATKANTIGFVNIPLVYGDAETAQGLPSTPTSGRITATADVYEKALVTPTGTAAGTLTLSNAAPTAVLIGTGTNAVNYGLRASAAITSTALVGQTGYTLGAGFETGNVINPGTNITAVASFDTVGKLNGVYQGTVTVGLQHADQTITGTAPNDLPNAVFSLKTTVAGNSGNGVANILPGQSYAGYYINRGSGANSTVSFLGGTASANTNLSVNFSDAASATAISDRAAVAGTATDKYVVQVSYDPAAVTNGFTNSAAISALNTSSKFVGAFRNNSDAGLANQEVIGAFDGNLTLGRFGVDRANHVVWAVVDRPGTYAAAQRTPGDANFDGGVNGRDLAVIANNFGSNGATWSQGDFDGNGQVNGRDLGVLANNFGAVAPAVATAATVKLTSSASPAAAPAYPAPAAGTLEFVVERSTGDVLLVANAVNGVAGYDLTSATSSFTPLSWKTIAAFDQALKDRPTGGKHELAQAAVNNLPPGLDGVYDLGNLLPANLTDAVYVADLTGDPLNPSNYTLSNGSNPNAQVFTYVNAPEPTTLSVIGLAGAAMLGRRRRRSESVAG